MGDSGDAPARPADKRIEHIIQIVSDITKLKAQAVSFVLALPLCPCQLVLCGAFTSASRPGMAWLKGWLWWGGKLRCVHHA